jgi:thiol-disulfide isomerase/thioredoxin
LFIALHFSMPAFCQTKSEDGTRPDPAALLQQVKEKYVQAKYYRIEAVEESEFSADYSRNWNKSVITAAAAPGNRYRFESHDADGGALRVSDGKTEWLFAPTWKMYTQKAAPNPGPAPWKGAIHMNQVGLYEAEQLMKRLANASADLLNPVYVADETLTLSGRSVPCYVIAGKGRYRGGFSDSTTSLKLWIDKQTHALRKTVRHQEDASIMNSPNVRLTEDESKVYPVADLDPPSVADSLFVFDPAGARLVDELPDPRKAGGGLVGQMAPEVRFPSADGKTVSLSSWRGKAVLLDFWATWCSPCVASMPALAKIATETSGKGLVLLSIDEDLEAKTASEFWAKQKESWPNFHDAEGRSCAPFLRAARRSLCSSTRRAELSTRESDFSNPNCGLRSRNLVLSSPP